MILTEIKIGKRGAERILLFDDGSKLRTQSGVVAEFGLYEGQELSEEQLQALKEAIGANGAKQRAARIVSAANISEKQLRRRLVQKGETRQHADEAARWLSELHLLDDRRTGEAIVHSALQKGYGERRIRQILREKEIPEEYWDDLLRDLPSMETAVDKLLRKKLKHIPPSREEAQRAAQSLIRSGHKWADIKAGLERISAESDWEDTECLPELE